MSDKVKIFPRSDKYRENWDRIFPPFDTDGAVYNWKTGELVSKKEHIANVEALGISLKKTLDAQVDHYRALSFTGHVGDGKSREIIACCCTGKTEGIGTYDLIEPSEDPLTICQEKRK